MADKGLKCNNIEALKDILSNGSGEIKPNGQMKHTIEECTINTYDTTGAVVIQDNSKEQKIKKNVESLVKAINNFTKVKVDK